MYGLMSYDTILSRWEIGLEALLKSNEKALIKSASLSSYPSQKRWRLMRAIVVSFLISGLARSKTRRPKGHAGVGGPGVLILKL